MTRYSIGQMLKRKQELQIGLSRYHVLLGGQGTAWLMEPSFHFSKSLGNLVRHFLIAKATTLPNLHIIDYVLGPPGSTHDATAFKESHAYLEQETLFHDGEWIWADSAYGVTSCCIAPYKALAVNIPENCQFNYHLSKVCVCKSVLAANL